MARASYKTRAIVLRKTKLGESDLILTLLAADGSQLRAVAKGARKPNNSFSARLELYSVVDVLCSEGKNLDIVKEARLLVANEKLRTEIEYVSSAAPMAELLDKITQAGLADERFFNMTELTFSRLNQAQPSILPALCAAHILKTLAFAGLRPSLKVCISCGNDIGFNTSGKLLHMSLREGGIACDSCSPHLDTIRMDPELVSWIHFMLVSTFAEIENAAVDPRTSFEILHFCQSWIQEHIGLRLKSLNFMFTCGLYE
ncbi:MAG: DNA repair protein RecO [Raoultibacter sp.]